MLVKITLLLFSLLGILSNNPIHANELDWLSQPEIDIGGVPDNETDEIKLSRNGRYISFNSGKGLAFENGELKLQDLRDHAAEIGEPQLQSGKQELLENLLNDHLFA